jgi:hypothetical protein
MKRMNTKRGLLRAAALGQGLLLVVAGCKSPTEQSTEGVRQDLSTKDGNLTVTAAGTIVNGYSALTATGTATVTVNAMADFATGGRPALAVGDLVLIIQMAGATINTADTVTGGISNYGSIANLGNAGNYELGSVKSIAGNVITLDCALQKAYTATGKAQVIRVPQYDTLTINNGTSITAPAWNGVVGGVVAVQAATSLLINATGSITVSELGFHGGAVHAGGGAALNDVTIYRSDLATGAGREGGEKGEGIAGWPNHDSAANFPFPYGRGAPANAGGGGNWHNAGGGGGANAGVPADWTGEGVMLSTLAGVVGGTAAWLLDPGDIANGGLTTSSGGGRGGYTYSNAAFDPTTAAGAPGPASNAWAGNDRRERGGLGGRPLASSPAGRLFMGGGGGAGDENNGNAIQGGRGGGLVFVIAGTVSGTGKIQANGAVGGASTAATGASGDGPGGGGGGGTVVVHAATLSGISIEAKGGLGGTQTVNNVNEAEGPGGGGGGGYIAVSGGTPASMLASGGLGGTTNSTPMAKFPSNGATAGHDGVTTGDATTISYCTNGNAALNTAIDSAPAKLTNVAAASFTFSSNQTGVTFECSIDGAAYAACDANYTIPAAVAQTLVDGPHSLDVRAKDTVGNVDTTPAHYDWTLDTIAPVARIVAGPAFSTTSTTAQFTLSSDAVGEEVVTLECQLDGAAYAPCTADYTIIGLTVASHTLNVRARDLAGNVSDPPIPYTWVVYAVVLDAGVDAQTPDAGIDVLIVVDSAAPDATTPDVQVILKDAAIPDTKPNTPDSGPVVLLDARADVTTAADLAADSSADSGRDLAPVTGLDARSDVADATDATDASLDAVADRIGAPDAQIVVDTRPADAFVPPPPTPDAPVVTPPDAAVPVPPSPDAPVTAPPKLMGSGFCAFTPAQSSAPGLFTFFLVTALALSIRRRRR